jgi:photosystem II stability/assembly factor-like uncharacterized protein
MKPFLKSLSIVILFLASSQLDAQTWTPLNTGTTATIYTVSFPTNDTGYVTTDIGTIRKTVNGGITWTGVTAPGTYLGFLEFMTGQKGLLSMDSALYYTANGGNSWTPVLADPSGVFTNVSFVNPLLGYVSFMNNATDTMKYFKTVNGGLNWTLVSAVASNSPLGTIYFINGTDGFAGHDAQIFATSNSANSWTSNYTNMNFDEVSNFYFPNPDTGYAVFFTDGVARTTDGGATWSMLTTNASPIFYAAYFSNGKNGFVCGGNGINAGYIIQTADAGISWTIPYTSSNTFDCMDFPSDSVGYVGGTNGAVIKFAGTITGIPNQPNESEITVFPNPAREYVEINNIDPGSKITLMDLSGQFIKQETAQNNSLELCLSDLTAGIYLLQITNQNQTVTQKLVIY